MLQRFFILFVLIFVGSAVVQAEPVTSSFSPVITSPAAPSRRALIIRPAFVGNGVTARGAVALADAAAYRDLLRLLGFSGTIIAADSRPALVEAARGFAETVPHESEVAVFVLGSIVESGGHLYASASDVPPSDRTPERIVTAGVDLADILGRVAERGPREVVAFVDECGGGEAVPSCQIKPTAMPDGVGAIIVHRVAAGNGDSPVAGLSSARQDLLPLMREPGLDYLDLYGKLKTRLEGTNDGILATAALSRSFSFLPSDFLARLPVECNRIDATSDAETLKRTPSVAPLVTACERAAATYDFSPYFKEKLAAAREQLAFQRAVDGCNDSATTAYLDAYANGAYRFAVSDHQSACERARQPPPAAPASVVQAAPAQVAPPPVETQSLQDQAYAAVMTYYARHSYAAGDDLGGLAALYPPVFQNRDREVDRNRQIADLARYYSRFTSFAFQVLPGSLDYSGCDNFGSCLMRGLARATTRKPSDDSDHVSMLRFSLRFDLRQGTKVLYECAVVQLKVIREAPCE